jgi:polar amino acid transport system substrate-binding protein
MRDGLWGGIVGLAVALSAGASAAADLYLQDSPPLSVPTGTHETGGTALGYGAVGDVVVRAMQRAGLEPTVVSEPWRRAQGTVSAGHNLLIAPLSRVAVREGAFQWVAPLVSLDEMFVTLGPPIDSYNQARATLLDIGVRLGTAQYEQLMTHGFSRDQIVPVPVGPRMAEMLVQGRLDAWFSTEIESRWLWHATGQTRPLVLGRVVDSVTLYLACSLQCDLDLIQRIADQIAALKATGETDRIVAAYR